jgi:hypothetical protein
MLAPRTRENLCFPFEGSTISAPGWRAGWETSLGNLRCPGEGSKQIIDSHCPPPSNTQYTQYSQYTQYTQYTVHSILHTVHSIQYTVYNIVYSTQYTVYSKVHNIVYSTQYKVRYTIYKIIHSKQYTGLVRYLPPISGAG